MSHVTRSVQMYASSGATMLPLSYLYAADSRGSWDVADQRLGGSHPHGYIHWSHFLYGNGGMQAEGFQCPSMERGGHPATNPEDGEKMPGQNTPNSAEDKQAPRMAYAANGALIPRNKLVTPGLDRRNQFVSLDRVFGHSDTIIVTEYMDNWKAVCAGSSDLTSKSHRPITPFQTLAGATCAKDGVFQTPPNAQLIARNTTEMVTLEWTQAQQNAAGAINSNKPLNAIGRHHPGGTKQYGGTTNFGYLDGHVERKHLFDTLNEREWGDRFYGLTGSNKVRYDDASYSWDDPRK
jgi:prepilin-type processing-associated H-X9-DG protein